MDIQYIGIDIGRGYTKAYTEIGKEKLSLMYKSVIGDARENKVEYKYYDNSSHIEYEGRQYFIGLLAEQESYSPIRNSADSKISKTVEILLISVLERLAHKEKVNIMLGVPYKNFTQQTLKEIKNKYEDRVYEVKNKVNGSFKRVKINKIGIFREADSALIYALNGRCNSDRPVGLINIGFRTLEYTYFDKNFRYNDSLSGTLEYGNSTILKIISDRLMTQGIVKTINEIDTSDDYGDMKREVYELASERIVQSIEEIWINSNAEMKLYASGGTTLNLSLDSKFEILKDSQLATAKGLYLLSKMEG